MFSKSVKRRRVPKLRTSFIHDRLEMHNVLGTRLQHAMYGIATRTLVERLISAEAYDSTETGLGRVGGKPLYRIP